MNVQGKEPLNTPRPGRPSIDTPGEIGGAGLLGSVYTDSVDETLELGRRIGASLAPGQVIALVGPLGAGKTHLVKGIAAGNGLPHPSAVTSPTFVLVNEYPGRLHLHHLDVYRLPGAEALDALGFDEMAGDTAAAVVEWADRAPDAMPAEALWIRIAVDGETRRRFDFSGGSAMAAALVRALQG